MIKNRKSIGVDKTIEEEEIVHQKNLQFKEKKQARIFRQYHKKIIIQKYEGLIYLKEVWFKSLFCDVTTFTYL